MRDLQTTIRAAENVVRAAYDPKTFNPHATSETKKVRIVRLNWRGVVVEKSNTVTIGALALETRVIQAGVTRWVHSFFDRNPSALVGEAARILRNFGADEPAATRIMRLPLSGAPEGTPARQVAYINRNRLIDWGLLPSVPA